LWKEDFFFFLWTSAGDRGEFGLWRSFLNAEMVQQVSFITSLVTSFVVFCILMVVYVILHRRPGNAVIYYPLRLLRGEDAATVAKRHGAFTWIIEAFRATDDDIAAAAGLDAAVYLHLFTAGITPISLRRRSHVSGQRLWTCIKPNQTFLISLIKYLIFSYGCTWSENAFQGCTFRLIVY
jgi:hypothetical protein